MMRQLLGFALIIVALFAAPAWADCGRDYTVAVFDWRKTDGDAGKGHGFEQDQDIWNEVFARAGCDVTWRVLTAKRLLNGVKRGSIDAAIPASKTPGRQAYAHFSDPYRIEELVGFVRREQADKIQIATVTDLRREQLRLALAHGGWYGPEIDKLIKTDLVFKDKVRFSDDAIVMVQWLRTGHVDMLLSWRAIAERLLQKRGLLGTEIVTYPAVLYDETVHLMLSKKAVSTDDVALLNAVLAEFLQSEQYAEILERY